MSPWPLARRAELFHRQGYSPVPVFSAGRGNGSSTVPGDDTHTMQIDWGDSTVNNSMSHLYTVSEVSTALGGGQIVMHTKGK